MLEQLYRGLTHLAGPAVRLLLDRRARAGKEDLARRGERLGCPALERPQGRLVWLHAASVGESLALLPLVERLLAADPAATALVTTGTVTSAALLATRLPARALHQYVPVDLPTAVERFLDHWRPDLVVWVESEFWPNLLAAIRRRGLPCALVNARISEKSFRGWSRVPRSAARLLSVFRTALAQTETEAARLRALGIADARAVGNLKYSAAPLPVQEEALDAFRAAIGDRPCWVFASTHPGEEALAATVHRTLADSLPGLLTIIVPRHPQRGPEVAALMREAGLTTTRRAAGDLPAPGCAVHVADTLGELGLFYRAAPVAVVGGSFVERGGHNPIEPALLGSTILYGPSMFNFAAIAEEIEAAGGALRVADADALAAALASLLGDADSCRRMAAAAQAVAVANSLAVERVMAALAPLLAEAGFGGGPG